VREEHDDMSVERPQQHPEQYRIPEAPTHVPGYSERIDNPNQGPKGPNWLKRSIALGAAASTLAVGIFIGVKAGGHDSDPTSPAKGVETSAPATPPSHEATTTPSTQETHDTTTSDLTPETFPFVGEDGKTYEGDAAFKRTIELPIDAYTEDNVKSELLPDAITALNEWMASGATPNGEKAYGNYVSPNGKTGLEGIAADFYDPAFRDSLTTNTTTTEDLTSMMETGHQNYLDLYGTTKDSAAPYHGEYKIHDIVNVINAGEEIQYDVHLSYEDNQSGTATGENTIPRRIVLKHATGTDGRMVWKFDRFDESAFAK
jgi:hypothetical protein